MPYNPVLLTSLKELISLIEQNQIEGHEGALQKFIDYLNEVQVIGAFDTVSWNKEWREGIWEFGRLFKKRNPQKFIAIISDRLSDSEYNAKEVVMFLHCEILVNFLSDDNEIKEILKRYINEYPFNPEFRNTLGHFLKGERSFVASINEYKTAMRLEPSNREYLDNSFNTEYSYLEELALNEDHRKAKAYLDEIFKDKTYTGQVLYGNILGSFSSRLRDHEFFQSRFDTMKESFDERIKNEFDGERKRIIEVLGFFSAIVAFILATVSLGKNFSFLEAIYFIIVLGVVLILFACSLSVLFSPSRQKILHDIKFWILTVGLLLLLAFILFSESIAYILQRFCRD